MVALYIKAGETLSLKSFDEGLLCVLYIKTRVYLAYNLGTAFVSLRVQPIQ